MTTAKQRAAKAMAATLKRDRDRMRKITRVYRAAMHWAQYGGGFFYNADDTIRCKECADYLEEMCADAKNERARPYLRP